MRHSDTRELQKASALASELISKIRKIDDVYHIEDEEIALPESPRFEKLHDNQIVEFMNELDDVLREADYPVERFAAGTRDEVWTLGSRTFVRPRRRIVSGYAEPSLSIPIVADVSPRAVSFLITIPGGRDYLEREQHGPVGWHYHYLDAKKRRSNIVLCWDTRAHSTTANPRPLFQETHGESRAAFEARPDRWGDEKKSSMYHVCSPDIGKWQISAFRCASNKAEPVWPSDAVLTKR